MGLISRCSSHNSNHRRRKAVSSSLPLPDCQIQQQSNTTTTSSRHTTNISSSGSSSHYLLSNNNCNNDYYNPRRRQQRRRRRSSSPNNNTIDMNHHTIHVRSPSYSSSNSYSSNSWSIETILAAMCITFGTAISSLCFQHVSNSIPSYFYCIAIVSPFSGFIVYSIINIISGLMLGRRSEGGKSSSSSWFPSMNVLKSSTLNYCVGIGICFATHNILVDYGKSGKDGNVPDVSTVLALILSKFVVPISLILESIVESHIPTSYELTGVIVLMIGVIITSFVYYKDDHDTGGDDGDNVHEKSDMYAMKILCLVLASIPLAIGFYIVKLARKNLPTVSGIELWTILCIPEFLFSIILAYLSQQQQPQGTVGSTSSTFYDKTTNIYNGILCVLAGIQPSSEDIDITHSNNHCVDGMYYFYVGIPFSFAFNLSIPILIQMKGSSTSVPLFRSLALPIASVLAMTNFVDDVISTKFSWYGILGVICCTIGLLIYYGKDFHDMHNNIHGYIPIPTATATESGDSNSRDIHHHDDRHYGTTNYYDSTAPAVMEV